MEDKGGEVEMVLFFEFEWVEGNLEMGNGWD